MKNGTLTDHLRALRGVSHLCIALSRSQQTHSQTCVSLQERRGDR